MECVEITLETGFLFFSIDQKEQSVPISFLPSVSSTSSSPSCITIKSRTNILISVQIMMSSSDGNQHPNHAVLSVGFECSSDREHGGHAVMTDRVVDQHRLQVDRFPIRDKPSLEDWSLNVKVSVMIGLGEVQLSPTYYHNSCRSHRALRLPSHNIVTPACTTTFIFPSSTLQITLALVAPLLLALSAQSNEYSRTRVYGSTLLDQASFMECIPFLPAMPADAPQHFIRVLGLLIVSSYPDFSMFLGTSVSGSQVKHFYGYFHPSNTSISLIAVVVFVCRLVVEFTSNSLRFLSV
ncbi:hypothetical protein F2Q68_00011455 [Brassica cretica]|uniref:Uncharacterized protein n=1 Tax=Brassica cretica TaxID=69181 RepID=A0A8S9KZ91_BRACR|nr:hypothetical protein F2Q68_00011455 [Brassica cretica]